MKYCCEVFQDLVANAGNPGVSAIARILGSQGGFFLQSRVCGFSDETQYVSAVVSAAENAPFPDPVRLTTLQGITYCPFCGSSLREVIEVSRRDFEALAEAHAKFLTPALQ